MRIKKSVRKELSDWMDDEPDLEYRKTIAGIIAGVDSGDSKSEAQAIELFGSKLSFGTAGLRGLMRPGPNGINRQTICRTTVALALHLLTKISPFSQGSSSVIVGYDARNRSAIFAQDAAEVLSGHGIKTLLFPYPVPTPFVAFATKKLGAAAGIMITASHNPSEYNGYKVFEGGTGEGSQILPETAQQIENLVETASKSLPWAAIPRNSESLFRLDETIIEAYMDEVCETLGLGSSRSGPPCVFYTPLHGVGGVFFLRASHKSGFPEPKVLEAQFQPDAEFPSVASPNPESYDSFAASFVEARAEQCDVVLAHDADADRLGVAVKDESLADGFRALTGNEIGVLLAWHIMSRHPRPSSELCLASSIVSSPILERISMYFGVRHETTPPGFKYLSRVNNLVFAYEEALGFLVAPAVLRDKDGISAALVFMDLLYSLEAYGETVDDLLFKIGREVGGFASTQIRIPLREGSGAESAMGGLRTMNPHSIRNVTVDRIEDFLEPQRNLPSMNLIQFSWNDGLRLTFRPSGTEPILKVYFDVLAEDMTWAKAILRAAEEELSGQLEQLLTNSHNQI